MGYIDGQVQLVGEQVKKVKCKLWGKCRAGSVNTANFRIASGANPETCPIIEVAGEVTEELVGLAVDISKVLSKLYKKKYRFVKTGTGTYNSVGGHHPLSKAAFNSDKRYSEGSAFAISDKALDDISGEVNTHRRKEFGITSFQSKSYRKFAETNQKLTIDKMVEIEIKAMTDAGIPDDVATGWMILALEDLSKRNLDKVPNLPYYPSRPN